MKLLTIALDGATLDLLKPWLADGELPHLAELFEKGASGTLNSTIPWATPTAFASFATGTNPGKHGVYDFGTLINEDYTAFIPTNGSNVNGRSLWKILSDAGMRCGVVNMPMTYPAEAINGFLVSGIPYPGSSNKLCYPPNLLDDLRQKGWDLARNASDDLGGNYEAYLVGLIELVKTRTDATLHLVQEYDPDFLTVHYLETDQVQHRFWQFLEDEPNFTAGSPLTDGMLQLWRVMDECIGRLVTAVSPDTFICIMSDHGFGPTRHQVWINNWLIENNFLILKPTLGVRFKKWLYRIGLSPAAIREKAPERLKLAILQFFERQKGRALAEQLEGDDSKAQGKGLMDRLTERLALDFYDVDWSKTVAFSTGTTAVGYVWLNLQGRDPQGTVAQGEEYGRVRQSIIDKLQTWEAVGEVLPREQVWQGSQLNSAPDIVIRWAQPTTDARYFQTRISSHHLMKPVPNDYASHRPDGMLLFVGQGVKPSQNLSADILDLAPTFLWLLDQPVPTYMDGSVLTDCVEKTDEVTFIEVEMVDTAVDAQLTAEEEDAIIESLKGLGYME
ncbi:MAG: alkaline phosphatase family protein [Chloroflexota bacterium]